MTLCGCLSTLLGSARPSQDSVSLRSVKMSEEAQIPGQRSDFAFLGHTPPPVSTLTYLLSVRVPARGRECACVCLCVCAFVWVYFTCTWLSLFFFSHKLVVNILHSITHHQTNIQKRSITKTWVCCFLLFLSVSHVWSEGNAHTDVERSWLTISNRAIITPCTPFTISSEGGWESKGAKTKTKKKKQGSF